MSGTLAAAAKKALVELLDARTGLDGIQVSYGWPGGDKLEVDSIYTGGRTRLEHEPAALKAGRTPRNETVEFDVVIVKFVLGGSAEDAELGAVELGQELEECVADNRTLGVAGINDVTVRPAALVSLFNDDGHVSELTYTVRYHARLT